MLRFTARTFEGKYITGDIVIYEDKKCYLREIHPFGSALVEVDPRTVKELDKYDKKK